MLNEPWNSTGPRSYCPSCTSPYVDDELVDGGVVAASVPVLGGEPSEVVVAGGLPGPVVELPALSAPPSSVNGPSELLDVHAASEVAAASEASEASEATETTETSETDRARGVKDPERPKACMPRA